MWGVPLVSWLSKWLFFDAFTSWTKNLHILCRSLLRTPHAIRRYPFTDDAVSDGGTRNGPLWFGKRMILESPRPMAPQVGAEGGSFSLGRLFDMFEHIEGICGRSVVRRDRRRDCLYIVL